MGQWPALLSWHEHKNANFVRIKVNCLSDAIPTCLLYFASSWLQHGYAFPLDFHSLLQIPWWRKRIIRAFEYFCANPEPEKLNYPLLFQRSTPWDRGSGSELRGILYIRGYSSTEPLSTFIAAFPCPWGSKLLAHYLFLLVPKIMWLLLIGIRLSFYLQSNERGTWTLCITYFSKEYNIFVSFIRGAGHNGNITFWFPNL